MNNIKILLYKLRSKLEFIWTNLFQELPKKLKYSKAKTFFNIE
jgi:tetrahydromethanopterin S-methyltransferase subunit G